MSEKEKTPRRKAHKKSKHRRYGRCLDCGGRTTARQHYFSDVLPCVRIDCSACRRIWLLSRRGGIGRRIPVFSDNGKGPTACEGSNPSADIAEMVSLERSQELFELLDR